MLLLISICQSSSLKFDDGHSICVLFVFAHDHAIVLIACLQTGTWDLVLAWLYRDRVLAPINIYKESNSANVGSRYHPDVPKTNLNSWHALGPRAERNKENNAIPTKWTTYKVSSPLLPQYTIDKDWHFDIFTEPTITLVYVFQIPQRPGSRTRGAGASSTCIEVFVDEECEEWVQWQVSISLAASFLWNFVIPSWYSFPKYLMSRDKLLQQSIAASVTMHYNSQLYVSEV